MNKSCTKSCAFSKCIGFPQLRVQLWGKTCGLTCNLIRTIAFLSLLSVGRMRKIVTLPLFSYLTTTFFRIHSQCSLLGLVSGNDCCGRIHVVDGAVCAAPPFSRLSIPNKTNKKTLVGFVGGYPEKTIFLRAFCKLSDLVHTLPYKRLLKMLLHHGPIWGP